MTRKAPVSPAPETAAPAEAPEVAETPAASETPTPEAPDVLEGETPEAEAERLRAEAAASDALLAAARDGDASAFTVAAPADTSEVEVVMLITISGARDGQPWPPAGGKVTLPADEAERYVWLGYAAIAE